MSLTETLIKSIMIVQLYVVKLAETRPEELLFPR